MLEPRFPRREGPAARKFPMVALLFMETNNECRDTPHKARGGFSVISRKN